MVQNAIHEKGKRFSLARESESLKEIRHYADRLKKQGFSVRVKKYAQSSAVYKR